MIIDEDIYLEHFGVKGMRWGVQNSTKKSGKERRASNRAFNKKNMAKRTPKKQMKKRTHTFIERNPAVVAVGALLAASIISNGIRDGNTSIRNARRRNLVRRTQPGIAELARHYGIDGF